MKFRPDPILIDMDGVLEDWYGSLLRQVALEATLGCPDAYRILESLPDPECLDSWELTKFIEPEHNSRFHEILNHPSIFTDTEPLHHNFREIFERIEEETRRQIFICTFPSLDNPMCIPGKFSKIEQRLGKKWTERLILTRDKSVVNGVILLDDRPDPAHGNHENTWQHVVFDQPWNWDHPDTIGKPRMLDWGEDQVTMLIGLINEQ